VPLTFAHPAAVWPLARLQLPVSALVVGSVAPDFLYFLQLAPRGHFGHTFAGLFAFCLPVGLVVLVLFHLVVKRPLADLLPVAVQRRLAGPLDEATPRAPSWWGKAGIAVLIGAATHVGWDAFTHNGGWGVERLGVLREPTRWGPAGYSFAQHGSTMVGLSVLVLWIRSWWRRVPVRATRPAPSVRTRSLRLGLLIGLPLGAGVIFASYKALAAEHVLRAFAGYAVVVTTSFTALAVLAYGAWATAQSQNAED
jgi:hypothetical protein